MRVSVIGGSTVSDEEYELAREVGRVLAERGHTVVCGGLGGVMEAVCRGAHEAPEERSDEGASKEGAGAKRHASSEGDQREPSGKRAGWDDAETTSDETGGHTIGILPGQRREAANEYVDTVIATGMGHARNAMVVLNGDAVIAIDGGGGTLSELGYGHVFDRPIAGLGTHRIETLDGIEHVATPEAAVEYVETVSGGR